MGCVSHFLCSHKYLACSVNPKTLSTCNLFRGTSRLTVLRIPHYYEFILWINCFSHGMNDDDEKVFRKKK